MSDSFPYVYIVVCDDLPALECGTVSQTGNRVGDIAAYTCEDGCVLTGTPTLTCEATGKWSHKPPACIGIITIITLCCGMSH